MDGLPSILLAWLCIYIFRPIATLIHELGHALIAHILTTQKVEVSIGTGKTKYSWKSKRIDFNVSFKKMISGSTRFSDRNLSKLSIIIILLAGPIFSSFAAFLGLILISEIKNEMTLKAITVGWICAHFLCFLRNILPFYLHSNQESTDPVPSDGLQIYQVIKEPAEKP